MTKYLISGYIGFDNFGDEAIASTLVSHLKSIGADEITLISSNPAKTQKLYDVKSVGMLNFLSAIKLTDVLISGGGSLLQDITSLKSLIYYLIIIFFALILRKKVIIFAQGFTPFKTKIGEFLTKIILKKCHKITVRDKKSQEFLSNLNIKSELIADPVFGININKDKHLGVGIQLRNFHSMNDTFLNKLAENIENHFKEEEIKLISLQDKLDQPVLEKFSQMLNAKGIKNTIYKNLSINEAIDLLSGLEYLIGMRFHATLVASKANVKVLGINYDLKVLKLANTIGFPFIEISDNDMENKFNELKSIDVSKYNIPEFIFPDIA